MCESTKYPKPIPDPGWFEREETKQLLKDIVKRLDHIEKKLKETATSGNHR